MSLFVDTSVWYAAADADDASNARAEELLSADERPLTTDHVLVATWTLLRWRIHREAAEGIWRGLRSGVAELETVDPADLQAAWTIGRAFADQDFSLVDRTSFAVMERLGLGRAATFDDNLLRSTGGDRVAHGRSRWCGREVKRARVDAGRRGWWSSRGATYDTTSLRISSATPPPSSLPPTPTSS